MIEVSTIQHGVFPADLETGSPEAKARAIRARADLRAYIDSLLGSTEEQKEFLVRAGRLTAATVWPHTIQDGYETATLYDDGSRVPDMQVKRITPQGERRVRFIQGDERLLLDVDWPGGRPSMMHGGLPYGEGRDFFTPGNCFVIDNRESQPGTFYDAAHEGLDMVPPLQDLLRYVLDSV